MKKNFKFHSGFSIAELLITMMITMLIAAALVPVIGPRKVKNADPRHVHGIAECYYDEDPNSSTYGHLMYYYADNNTHMKADDQILDDLTAKGVNYCTFDVPSKAAYFDIYAIGAGSRGTGGEMPLTQTLSSQEKYSRDISITPISAANNGKTIYSWDLGEGIKRHVGEDNEKLKLVEGENFDKTVKNSVTRWAERINHMADIIAAGGNPQVDDGTYSSTGYNPDGEYLYAEFKGIRGPIGAGGAALSVIPQPWSEITVGEPPQTVLCTNVCAQYGFGSEQCPEVYHSVLPTLYDETAWVQRIQREATPNGSEPLNTCKYYHLHAKGGYSAPAIGFDSATSLLVPIDGESEPNLVAGSAEYMEANENGGVVKSYGHTKLQISIKSQYGSNNNNLQLSGSFPGYSAMQDAHGNMHHGCSGLQRPNTSHNGCVSSSHPGYSNCSVVNTNVPMKTLHSNGNMSNFTCSDMSTNYGHTSADGTYYYDYAQAGAPRGPYHASSGYRYINEWTAYRDTHSINNQIHYGDQSVDETIELLNQESQMYTNLIENSLGYVGNLGNVNPVFTWTVNEPKADITYTTGGRAAELRSLTFAHLQGSLYLQPGKNNNGAPTNTFIYTDKDNRAGSTVLMAESPQDNISDLQHGSYTLGEVGDSALPTQAIMDQAYPDNGKFYAYIDAIRSARQWGLSGGLMADCASSSGNDLDTCINNKYWPGYGGSGAFPMLSNQNFIYTLTLTNKQPYVQNYADTDVRKEYKRVFPRNMEFDLTCPDGYYDPMKDAVAEEGQEILHYCTAASDMRRDGAVVIVW